MLDSPAQFVPAARSLFTSKRGTSHLVPDALRTCAQLRRRRRFWSRWTAEFCCPRCTRYYRSRSLRRSTSSSRTKNLSVCRSPLSPSS